jgi:hypothetical protein
MIPAFSVSEKISKEQAQKLKNFNTTKWDVFPMYSKEKTLNRLKAAIMISRLIKNKTFKLQGLIC